MDKQQADHIITEYLDKIYGFAVKRSFYLEEAEELCADIVAEVYTSLRSCEEIYNLEGYIWRISEHTYAKYVTNKKRKQGVSIDGLELPYEQDFFEKESEEKLRRLRQEIAYLSKLRREIVYAFYYENKAIAAISREKQLSVGTVKWHLNKARKELKEGFRVERKIGKLGLKPLESVSIGHGGTPGSKGGPEYYLEDKLNLNIVYSVYHTPKTKAEIAAALGVNPVFIEDRIAILEENGFLVRRAGERYTTYVCIYPETYSKEQQEAVLKKQLEVAAMLVESYVPAVRAAIADVQDVYIPGGNRELLEAAALFYGVSNKCRIPMNADLSRYRIQTTDGGHYFVYVTPSRTPSDPDYEETLQLPAYWGCGDMYRDCGARYPGVQAWAVDTRYCSREGRWQNNLWTDYEYPYEYMTGAIEDVPANANKFARLRERKYLTTDNRVNVMVVKGERQAFFDKIPALDETLKKQFTDFALETAMAEAKRFPEQMRSLIVNTTASEFVSITCALMVMDKLYEKGIFRPLTENERVTAHLLMFCDTLPQP